MSNFKLKAKVPLHLLITAMISVCIVTGCDYYFIPSEVRKSLELAGENKHELLTVINHYKKTDKEKLEAAYYLIANMPGHYSIGGQSVFDPVFDLIKPILKESGRTEKNGELFTKLIDSVSLNSITSFVAEEDIKNINADYLIENIELAFEAYSKIPEAMRCDRETFLRFVLPYRNSNEPVEPGLRKQFLSEYHWTFERMEECGSLQKTLCDLLDSIDIRFNSAYKYPYVMPLSSCKKIGVARNCDDMVNLVIYIARSLGIPAAFDFTPFIANNVTYGHAWIVFFIQDNFYGVDIPNKQVMNRLYKYDTLPKIYRRCFDRNPSNSFIPNSIDITNQYRNTVNIQLKCNKYIKKAQLNVFQRKVGWKTVAETFNKKGQIVFENVGRDIIYAILEADDTNGRVINSPFYVNETGEIIHLIPDHKNRLTAVLTSKFPPFALRHLHLIQRILSINGAEIQAANKADFSDAITLLKIENFNSSNKQIIKTGNIKKYRNYRLISPESSEIHLAGFNLIKNNRIIHTKWQVFVSKNQLIHNNGFNVIDDEPLTYISGKYLSVNYYFDKPVVINEFQIQARNKDNNVKPGCQYELMYWDNDWISAGLKQSNDTLLIYENIPSGALYWLKNHTEGNEEQLFLLDNEGYQYWPGVTNYMDSYHDFLELEKFCDAEP